MRMKKQSEEIEHYAVKIGLDNRLVFAPRTIEQADTLLSLQLAILKYDSHSYKAILEQNQNINDPYRDKTSVISKIDDIEQYMDKYYDGLMFITERNQLKQLRTRINNLQHYTAESFISHILDTVLAELYNIGFKESIIIKGTKNVLPLKSTFRSFLTD